MLKKSNFTLTPMAVAALQQIKEWGTTGIQSSIAAMTAFIARQLTDLGLSVIPEEKRCGHILGVRFPGGLPAGIAEKLAAANVFVSIRGSAVRVAPHLHNTSRDMDKLLTVLSQTL